MRTSLLLALLFASTVGCTEATVSSTCHTVALPGTAPDPIAIHGSIVDAANAALAGATVTVKLRSDNSVVASGTTAADGTYALSLPTGGASVDAWLTVSLTGKVNTHYFFGGVPYAGENTVFNFSLYTLDQLDRLALTAGNFVWDHTLGFVELQVHDCISQDIGRVVTISSVPAGTPWFLYITHQEDVNLPPGDATIDGTYMGVPLRTAHIQTFPGEFSTLTMTF